MSTSNSRCVLLVLLMPAAGCFGEEPGPDPTANNATVATTEQGPPPAICAASSSAVVPSDVQGLGRPVTLDLRFHYDDAGNLVSTTTAGETLYFTAADTGFNNIHLELTAGQITDSASLDQSFDPDAQVLTLVYGFDGIAETVEQKWAFVAFGFATTWETNNDLAGLNPFQGPDHCSYSLSRDDTGAWRSAEHANPTGSSNSPCTFKVWHFRDDCG